jgi:hypothetical protein
LEIASRLLPVVAKNVNPEFEPLRSDPRFEKLVNQIILPDAK